MLYKLNEQQPQRTDRDPRGQIRVHSVFPTIQGEGPFAGRAALFIRLAGCNLQCPGCDTEYTSVADLMEPETLAVAVAHKYKWPWAGLVVITGGEPFRQNITPLTFTLIRAGYQVQVESNGTLYDPHFPHKDRQVTVVISPKTGRIHPDAARRADAYKYVLTAGDVAEDGLPIHALGNSLGKFPHVARPPEGWTGPIYINPMDAKDPYTNEQNIQAVVESVMTHKRYVMGVQMHKLTGLP